MKLVTIKYGKLVTIKSGKYKGVSGYLEKIKMNAGR